MRVHVTGMSPRMVSQRAREQITFARLLTGALGELGHEVHQGAGDVEEADLVIVGVTSPLSPGATYALSGLVTIGRALEVGQPLALFVDDPDLSKTRYGAVSAREKPDRLYTDYLMSKRVKASVDVSLSQRRLIREAIWMLAGEDWPPVLLPLHPWGMDGMSHHAKKLGVVSEVVGLDISPMLERPELEIDSRLAGDIWLTDSHYTTNLLDPMRVRWPVVPINSKNLATHPIEVYRAANGIHQGAIDGCTGWWTPTPQYVAWARRMMLMDSEESVLMGTEANPYYITSDTVEDLDYDNYLLMQILQHEHLQETMWDRHTLCSALADVTGRLVS